MTSGLYRLGLACAARPWRVVVGWVLALILVTVMAATVGGSYRDDMTAPGSASDRATQSLRASYPDAADARANVVATWPGTADAEAIERVVARIKRLPQVAAVTTQVDETGRTVIVQARYDVELADLDAAVATEQLTAAARTLGTDGARVAVGGEVPESLQGPNGIAEVIGVAVALLVLLLALASAWAACLPLMIAAAGLGTGLGLIGLLAAAVPLTSVSPTLASMIGLGIGIDYALFVVARHRDGLARGLPVTEAAGQAIATAGKAVCFAGLAVLLGITGLAFSGVPGFAWMGLATGLVVLTTVIAAITLLPALLGLLGVRVFGRRARRAVTLPADSFHSARAESLARRVVRRPVRYAVGAVVVLLTLAAPALGLQLGQNDAGSERASAPTRQAYDQVANAFGPGANGPLVLVVDRSEVPAADVAALRADLSRERGVREVSAPELSPDGQITVITVIPSTGPQDRATSDLVGRLHDTLPNGVLVTGPTAAVLDLTDVLADHLWMVITAVLVATFLLLLVVFRSVVLPVKAVLANLLSIGAAYGLMTLAFQTDAGAAVIGLSQPVPIAAWAPVVLFAILFGLSMDYEVFMLTAIQERHAAGADAAESVVGGLSVTARVIASAAAIMVAVAGGFALDPSVMVKIIGVGMVCAIVLDVTVVRLLLVPAAVAAMGRANWWLPGPLDRLLPRLDVHGLPAELPGEPESEAGKEDRRLAPAGLG